MPDSLAQLPPQNWSRFQPRLLQHLRGLRISGCPQVLQEMLDMLRDHRNTEHSAHLEWIVIWLIVVEVIVGLFECASILGWVGHE